MKKLEFLQKLTAKLSVLQQSEVAEIINEYTDHIDAKIASGISEEEVINDFGNIDELAKEILLAYHVERKGKTLEDYIAIGLAKINDLTAKVMRLDSNQLIGLIVKFILLMILFAIVKWPLLLILNLFLGLLDFVSWGLFNPLKVILSFSFEVLYFCMAVYLIYQLLLKDLTVIKSKKKVGLIL